MIYLRESGFIHEKEKRNKLKTPKDTNHFYSRFDDSKNLHELELKKSYSRS